MELLALIIPSGTSEGESDLSMINASRLGSSAVERWRSGFQFIFPSSLPLQGYNMLLFKVPPPWTGLVHRRRAKTDGAQVNPRANTLHSLDFSLRLRNLEIFAMVPINELDLLKARLSSTLQPILETNLKFISIAYSSSKSI